MSDMTDQADRLATIARLGDPLRRAMYLFVVSAPAPVSREQTAEKFGVSRGVAAFHLDKLAELGLLEVDYQRPAGRSGPGAGRTAKFYRSTTEDVSFNVPPREYELAGRLLAEAITVSERDEIPVGRALEDAARKVGQSLGGRAREQVGPKPGHKQLMDAVGEALNDCGYEPLRDRKWFTLMNCPFHALAQQYRNLVCGMNLELMAGFTESLGASGLEARLEPLPGQCCVRLVRSRPAAPAPGGPSLGPT
jgi:predicted ArsR family transcriptional regulator